MTIRLHINRPRGFTLVETLVSSMIITLVILGPLTVASDASAYARTTKDTLVANYLAQEAIELLRHQQDSVYLRCVQSATASCPANQNELPRETAWRIFKERVGSNAQGASCFSSQNASGCSFDFIDMTANEDIAPAKYVSTAASCNTLSMERTSKLYVCTGAHGSGASFTLTRFTRTVLVESIQTFAESGQVDNDDLRVTVIVTFKRANGYTSQVKVVDFLHTRA